MQRSKGLRRLTELVRKTPLGRVGLPRRPEPERPGAERRPGEKGGAMQRRRSTGPDAATVELVLARAGGRDEISGEPLVGERGRDWDIHHRRARRMGGDRRPDTNSPANLLVILRGTHRSVESHRAEALTRGWLLHGDDDPAAVAVLLHRSAVWKYLTHDGRLSDQPPGVDR